MSDLQKRFDDLLFGVRRSVRYHSHRESFFRGMHRLVLFIALLSGSSFIVVFTLELSNTLPLWGKLAPAGLVTVLTALDWFVRQDLETRQSEAEFHRAGTAAGKRQG